MSTALPHVVSASIPAALSGYVARIQLVHGAPPGNLYQRLPDGQSELVVHLEPGDVSATWIGTRTHALRKPTLQFGTFVLVRFAVASAYPFFAGPASQLTDELVELDPSWTRALQRSESAQHAERALANMLATRLRDPSQQPSAARRVRAVVQTLSRTARLPTVRQLADELGASERQLRRSFDEIVGLPPKRYLRVLRFQRAWAMARASARASADVDWVAIAQHAGYFDQAHMIGDFQELAGASPTQLR